MTDPIQGGDDQVTLTWTASSGATSYTVVSGVPIMLGAEPWPPGYRRLERDLRRLEDVVTRWERLLEPPSHSTVTGLIPGTTYHFPPVPVQP
jgi:hypothetical protein